MPTMLRFANFLAPNLTPFYQFVADYVARRLDCATQLINGDSFDQFAQGQAEVGFICGLPYVNLVRKNPPPVELLAAPVLQGERYQGKPIYFSDVIVYRDSPYQSFTELRGCRWSYNDPDSQSGYGITRYWLARMGERHGFFGEVVEAGYHQKSIRLVAAGKV